MSNSYQWGRTIKAEGVVLNPMGSGRSAPIAPEDIAAVAVRALTDSSILDEVLEVTGGELLSVPAQVNILAEILGKAIRCVDIPTETAVQGMIQAGVSAPVASAVGKSFEVIRDGGGAAMRDTVKRVTGRQPKTYEQWARENKSRFA